jgi:hypothetical protein
MMCNDRGVGVVPESDEFLTVAHSSDLRRTIQ